MKYVLALSSLLLVVGCDAAAPREAIPEGQSLQAALERLPTIETEDPTDPTGGSTGPTCDEPCGTVDCAAAYDSACYTGICVAGCCGAKKRTGVTVCGTTCCVPTNGTCSCTPAAIACTTGYANCNSDLSDGCETLTNTAAACGSSCTNCNVAVAHADAKCVSGTSCDYNTCAAGWADCDGNRANGCETSTLTSTGNCGACGQACTAPSGGSAICNGGTCDFTCGGGLKRCGDECKQCCGDNDCTSPPTRCDQGKCNAAGTCEYSPKSCLVRDCYSTPACDDATGQCKATPLTGGACGNNACIEDSGTCNAGACEGATAKDCSMNVPICKVGVCDQSDGSCQYEDQPDETTCTPTDKCQEAGVCIGGVCNGAMKTCADPGACRSSLCNPATGSCDVVALIKGTPCTLSNPCRQNEECDGDGACVGTMLTDGTPCSASCATDEASQCVAGECGCVKRPDMTPIVLPEEIADMGDAVDSGGADKNKGCAVVGGGASTAAPSLDAVVTLLLFFGVLGGLRWIRRPQARLVKYARRRRF